MNTKRLKSLLCLNGITQRELAKQLRVTEATFSRYVHGVREPNFDKMITIAKTLGTSVDYLIGYDDARQKENGTGKSRKGAVKSKDAGNGNIMRAVRKDPGKYSAKKKSSKKTVIECTDCVYYDAYNNSDRGMCKLNRRVVHADGYCSDAVDR